MKISQIVVPSEDSPCPSQVLRASLASSQEVLKSALEVGRILSIVLWKSENRIREPKTVAQDHAAGQWQGGNSDSESLTPESLSLIAKHTAPPGTGQ